MATATIVSSAVESKDVTTIAPTRSDGRRRTERVRREKPNYYDASAFIRKTRVNKFKYLLYCKKYIFHSSSYNMLMVVPI